MSDESNPSDPRLYRWPRHWLGAPGICKMTLRDIHKRFGKETLIAMVSWKKIEDVVPGASAHLRAYLSLPEVRQTLTVQELQRAGLTGSVTNAQCEKLELFGM